MKPLNTFSISNIPECYVFDDHAIYAVNVMNGSLREIVQVDSKEIISGIKFSPDLKYACVITGTKKFDSSKLYVYDVEKQSMHKVIEIGTDSIITIPFWSPDNRQFVLLFGYHEISTGDFTQYEYYWLKQYNLEQSKLLDIIKLVEPYNSLEWSPDGRYIVYNGKENKSFSLYIYDTFNQKNNIITTNLHCDWWFKNLNHWNKNSNLFYEINGSVFFSYDVKASRYKQVLDSGKQIMIQQWAESGDKALFTAMEGKEVSLFELDMDDLQLNLITHNFQVDSPRWSQNGKIVSYFTKSENDQFSRLIVYDLSINKILQETTTGSIEIYPWDADPTYSAWSFASKELLVLIKKENQSQYITKISITKKDQSSISSDWDYIYNYWWEPNDQWIAVSGNRKEKDVLEFIPLSDPDKRITFTGKRFTAWKNLPEALNQAPVDSTGSLLKPTPIYYFIFLGLLLIFFFWQMLNRRKKKN